MELFRLEDIQNMCDMTICDQNGLQNSYITTSYMTINKFDQKYLKDVKKLFIYGHVFAQVLESIVDQVSIDVLCVGNSDENITMYELNLLPLKIKYNKCYIQNLIRPCEGVKPLPIGIENRQWERTNYSYFYSEPDKKFIPYPDQVKQFVMFCSINPMTHSDRKDCIKTLKAFGIVNKRLIKSDYCDQLSKSKFCICPRGNGYDTHRFWEALYNKTIPIVQDSPFIRTLINSYPNLPCVVIQDWDNLPIIDFDQETFSKDFNIDQFFDDIKNDIQASEAKRAIEIDQNDQQ